MTAHITRLNILQVIGLALLVLQLSSKVTIDASTSVASGQSTSPTSAPGIACTSPPPLNNAIPTTVNSTTTYTCKDGYYAAGDLTSTCLAYGTWSKLIGNCTIKYCGEPPALGNASIANDMNTVNTSKMYTCNNGYKATDNIEITCLATGNWSVLKGHCTVKDCGNPPALAHASIPNDMNTFNTSKMYTCNNGYKAYDNMEITCLATGNWSVLKGNCTVKDCGNPPALAHASIPNDMNTFNTSKMYTCNNGYKANDNMEITCLATGNWSVLKGNCTVKDCGNPPALAHASIPNDMNTFNTSKMYTCNNRYKATDNMEITCLATGKWSVLKGQCTVKDCGNPPALAHASIPNDMNTFNTSKMYTCNNGYKANDNMEITCLATGNWSVLKGLCTVKDCGEPVGLENANASLGLTTVNSTIIYTCKDGYNSTADLTITCLATGNWTVPIGNCEEIDCGEPVGLENANASLGSTTVNSTIIYTCKDGYNSTADLTITCLATGNWTVPIGNCEEIVYTYNETCIEQGHCSTVNASCTLVNNSNEHRCLCNATDFYNSANNTCYKRIEYNQNCVADKTEKQCKTMNAVCSSKDDDNKCLCKDVDYYINVTDSCSSRPVAPLNVSLQIDTGRTPHDSFTVNWSGTQDNQGFHIVLEMEPSTPTRNNNTKQWGNIAQYEDIHGLQSGTKYTFFVYLERDSIRTVLLDTISSYTKPEPVEYIHFTSVMETNITASWPNDIDRPCHSYSIMLDDKHVIIPRTNNTTESHTFSGLDGGTQYNVTVIAVVPGQESENTTNNTYTRPEPISWATATSVHSTSVELELKSKNQTKKDGLVYHVYVEPNIQIEDKYIHSENETVTISPLQPGTLYSFKIYSFLQNLESERFVMYEVFSRPLPPDQLTVSNVSQNFLEIHWTINASYHFDQFIIEYSEIDTPDIIATTIDDNTTTRYDIHNLTAGTGYTFNVYSSINGTRSETPAELSVFTIPDSPSQPILTERFDTSLTIQFNSDNLSYNGFMINGTFHEIGDGNITLSDLNPGRYYSFTIFTVANFTIQSFDNVTFDSFTRPAPPVSATFIELHETRLTVNWTEVANGNVDGYIVNLTGDDYNESANTSSDTNAMFSYLTAGREYKAMIYSYWKGELSNRWIEHSTHSRPSAPVSRIVNVNIDSFTLEIMNSPRWEKYKVLMTPGVQSDMDNNTFPMEDFPITIEGLTAGTNYTLEIYSIIGGVESENSQTVYSYTKPESVDMASLKANKDSTNSTVLAIQWDGPNNGSVDSYELQFHCQSPNGPESLNLNFTRMSTKRRAIAWGLEPGTSCTVNITTHVGNQTGDFTEKSIEWSTTENAPEMVQDMTVLTDARSLNVAWKSPSKPNGVIRMYLLDVIDSNKNCTVRRTTFNCSDCKDTSKPTCQDGPDSSPYFDLCDEVDTSDEQNFTTSSKYEHQVTNLHPYRNYTAMVIAFTRCYGQQKSLSKLTKEDAPDGYPINVTQSIAATTNDVLRFSWLPPNEDDQNGIIRKYTIYNTYKNRTCFDSNEGDEIIEITNVTADAINNYPITGRYAYWSYSISISAWTDVGEGPKSTAVLMMTNQTTPGEISKSPLVNCLTKSTCNLSWKPPCYVNGIIDHYRIHVINVDSSTLVHNITTISNGTDTVIQNVLPFHNYTMSVAAVNIIEQEGHAVNTTAIARTKTGAPHQPTNVNGEAISAKSLKVTWTKPDLYTGITRYTITSNDSISFQQNSITSEWDFNLREYVIGDLDEFWNYTVTVTAITSEGSKSSPSSSKIRTMEAAPGAVTKLNISTEQDVTRPRSVEVTWDKPTARNMNGILLSYFVEFSCKSTELAVKKVNASKMTYKLTSIKPSSCNVSVYAATAAGNGTSVKQNIIVPSGAPIKPIETQSDPLMKEATDTSVADDTKQIAVGIPTHFLCNDRNGKPTHIGLIVSAADKATDKPCIGDTACFNKKKTDVYKNWFQVHTQDNPTPYITTLDSWNPCPPMSDGGRRKRSAETTGSFMIGVEGECSGVNVSLNCNGQLKPGTSYRVRSFACTDGGCSESEYSLPIETTWVPKKEPDLLVPIVAGVASAVVVLVVIGVVIFLKRRQAACFAKSAEEGSTHSRTEPGALSTEMISRSRPSSKVFSPPKIRQVPIQLSEFPETVEKMKMDSALIFSDAYKTLREISPVHPMTIAESQNCRPKNRYTNILPFDHSRVKILPLDGEEGSDYINASYIPGYTSRREYIATQGPMPATFDDFWRMVWEQNVEIVVMLTKLVEKGRNKCDKYWPNSNEPQFYGDLSISVMSESNLSDYTIRIMEVKLKDEKRTVKQFSFLKWPDMGCPEYPELLLDFVKDVRQHESAKSKGMPLVVHCSAGVGRTGTFIAVDHLLQHIRDHDEVDIFALVAEMRNNRCNMVQTEDQYIYIHDCIKEFITSDEDEFDDDDDDHVYANSPNNMIQENVYENTAFTKQF